MLKLHDFCNRANISTVVNGFTSLAREVATIPHDPQMVEGWLNGLFGHSVGVMG